MRARPNIRRLARLGICAALALIMYIIESAVPVPVPIPGIKLGLSNLVILFLLIRYKPLDGVIVLGLKVLLGALLAGQAVSLIYSLCGGLLCFGIMWLLSILLQKRLIPVISMFGALFHNLGQILAARVLTGSPEIWYYLPYLVLSAIVTGLLTGCICLVLCRKLYLPMFEPSDCDSGEDKPEDRNTEGDK